MLLSKKIAIITGGARGIGRGIALKFAEEGSRIVVADILTGEAKQTVDEIAKKGVEAIYIRCDVSDERQAQSMVEETIKTFGTVDILVNDAGISHVPKSITDVTRAEWDRVLAVNLSGVFFCCKAVVPFMKEKRYGKIINISSCDAIAPPFPVIAYSAAKAGVLGITIDLALEMASFNVCVNAILPGAIPTNMWDLIIPPEGRTEEFLAEVGKTVSPMERFGTPEEIAGAALFFASNLSAYVTGERIIVGGGYPLRLWKKEG